MEVTFNFHSANHFRNLREMGWRSHRVTFKLQFKPTEMSKSKIASQFFPIPFEPTTEGGGSSQHTLSPSLPLGVCPPLSGRFYKVSCREEMGTQYLEWAGEEAS